MFRFRKNSMHGSAFSAHTFVGDSGGPLLVDGVQVGIVSWSVRLVDLLKCCTLMLISNFNRSSRAPSHLIREFTRVSKFNQQSILNLPENIF